jgi:RimJ/RimL family protein N-acetyltransferase
MLDLGAPVRSYLSDLKLGDRGLPIGVLNDRTETRLMIAPTIETLRLRLRRHEISDYEASAAMWADENTVRFISGRPSTHSQSWGRVLNYAGLWAMLGFGYWAVEERATGVFVGEVGFADFKRDIAASMRNVPEIGWALVPRAQGKGCATEAVSAAVAWADANLASLRTVCMIAPENAASIRVAQKCGFTKFDSASYNEQPVLFYERLRAAEFAHVISA